MGFRKCFYKDSAAKRINWKKIAENDVLFTSSKIFIPQDFQTKKVQDDNKIHFGHLEHDDQELITLFNELPINL